MMLGIKLNSKVILASPSGAVQPDEVENLQVGKAADEDDTMDELVGALDLLDGLAISSHSPPTSVDHHA
jgi:hypothetical protein